MSKSLWSEVLEGTFNTEDNGSNYEAEVESYVTDEPETMVAYVASCTEGMLAVQTAMATMEGRCAVQYIRGEKEEAKATMEGALRNAWETLKEWVRKAYHAIKKFLKKAWNKMKGYINVFKAMVTKYNYVLKGKVPSGVKVAWVEIRMDQARVAVEAIAKELQNKDFEGVNKLFGNASYHQYLENKFFPNGRHPEDVTLTAAILSEAIKVADDGFDKVYSEAFALGERTERETLKALDDDRTVEQDKIDDIKKDDKQDKAQGSLNKRVRLVTNVMRDYSAMVNTAASLKVRLSVKACRKAIREQAQNSSATYGLESTDFSAVMGEIL